MGEKDTEEEEASCDGIPLLTALIDEYPSSSLEKMSDAEEGTGGKTAFFSSLADFVDKGFLLLFFSSITTAAVVVVVEVDDGGSVTGRVVDDDAIFVIVSVEGCLSSSFRSFLLSDVIVVAPIDDARWLIAFFFSAGERDDVEADFADADEDLGWCKEEEVDAKPDVVDAAAAAAAARANIPPLLS